ncbi:MAG: excinuclease ABC subunit UvrB [bacterium]|nr:excinuclease ABC subunit UvrB [bacterium]
MSNKFKLIADFKPTGDQPDAIEKLVDGLNSNIKDQVLLGVTGSGKTFTLANVIEKVQKPTLVISHNKTLAGQLYQEFKEFFPNNAVEYFVSYYDYYQPESYLPPTDTYIAKESSINEEIDKLRLSATTSLLSRKDVIVVSSVSCIYNIGSPKEYGNSVLLINKGLNISKAALTKSILGLHYNRNDMVLERGSFRVKGDIIEIIPSYSEVAYRIEFLESTVTNIYRFDSFTGRVFESLDNYMLYPAKHFIASDESFVQALIDIENDMNLRLKELKDEGKVLEAYRLEQRTKHDLEMIKEVGYVNGIENYSRYFDGRHPGAVPYTLLDYFPKDFLLAIDESHMTLPQVRGMYNGDRSRKQTLVDYGFRLPSAMDNRPLKFDEFLDKVDKAIYISATPSEYEVEKSIKATKKVKDDGGDLKEDYVGIAEQLIRPTGIIEPIITIKPIAGQIDDLYTEIEKRVKVNEKVLITTLTKKMSEELSLFLKEKGIKAEYLHSDIDTLDRMDILDNLRKGEFDVLVGINLLREGLDLPEVSLVAILDADKEGFLRSETALVQTMGRAARNINGQVILYADVMTGSITRAVEEVTRRRQIQVEYNQKHNIIPKNIKKEIKMRIVKKKEEDKKEIKIKSQDFKMLPPTERTEVYKSMEEEMYLAADMLNFELATEIRDKLRSLKKHLTSQ